MAKAKRSSRRDLSNITSQRLSTSKPDSPRVSSYLTPPPPRSWRGDPPPDDRVYQPTPPSKRPYKTVYNTPARVVAPPLPKARVASSSHVYEPFNQSIPQALVFQAPRQVNLCIKRKERREVIMATGHGGGQRKGKRKPSSNIRCK